MVSNKKINSQVFVSITYLAEFFECSTRTIHRMIERGVLPPLPGNQAGLGADKQGWFSPTFDEWMRRQAIRLDSQTISETAQVAG